MLGKDIVLLTVDSWRYDTTHLTQNIVERLPNQTEAICPGAATNWVFPAILSGTYYPNAYNEAGNLEEDVLSLPQILSDEGYATAGFVANNPYVSKWESHFDKFWNGDIDSGSTEWYSSDLEKWISRAYRTTFFKKRTAGDEVAQRAGLWYRNQSCPRFLWMHLMEPHLPYYPGLEKARKVGLLDSYRSVISYQRHGDHTSPEFIKTQRRLYNKCVERFDEYAPDLLGFVDEDAIVVSFGDHGEEFDHGHYDHERLYDECVRVPLFSVNSVGLASNRSVRQIDIAPILLKDLGLSVPPTWDGEGRMGDEMEPALMVTPEPGSNLLHTGIRTERYKLIKSFDRDANELARTELYDLSDDPGETNNIYDSHPVDELEHELDEFVSEHRPAIGMNASVGMASEEVAARLEDLGYK
jgi:arylsulfatase A-like enzyme